jgi:hypothetical protein
MADKVHLTKQGIQALGWDGEVGPVRRTEDPDGARSAALRLAGTSSVRSSKIRNLPCRRVPFGGNHPISRQFDLVYLEIAKSFEWDA